MIEPLCPDYTNTPVSPRRPPFHYTPADPLAPPQVSIVTPFYNTGPVFHETAHSVFRQSFQQWEWLIVNDGSTAEESLRILEEYRHRDPRIRVLDHGENRGLSAARNTGFREARSPYVVQLDSDDLLEPTAVEKWVWCLESYPEYSFVKGYSVGFGAQEYLWQKGFHDGSAFLEDNLIAATSALRKTVHQAIGGYDETLRGGLEDWDFWLRCASKGYWGGTVPEYLDWYRRRPSHQDRWPDFDGAQKQRLLQAKLKQRYPHLWQGGFPQIRLRWHMPYDEVPTVLPFANRLKKEKGRVLLLVPWLEMGGADKFNLDLIGQLIRQGWEVSVAATLEALHRWLSHFTRLTPDVFILHHFLRLTDYPRFLHYLIQSRQIDIVLITNSELGYLLLPYLRSRCPEVSFVDFCHMEEEGWKGGGYPRLAVEYGELLDLHGVSSEHLKRWMVSRGAREERIRVCYTNVDVQWWKPDEKLGEKVRKELGIGQGEGVILYAGRLCAQKQPQVFGQTLVRLRQKGVEFVAVVAGDGPDRGWLEEFLQREGVAERVRLLGAVSAERMRELMVAADLLFLPSKWEGIAFVVYEAMASGLAIVGANVGGQKELLTPECGVLIECGEEEKEVEEYAEVLARLLRNSECRQKMGQAARRRVEKHFRLEKMGDQMHSFFHEALHLLHTAPPSLPPPGLAHACATQAIEYTRLSNVADGLWRERERAQAGPLGFHPYLLDPYSDSWRTLAYFTLRRLFLPYYRAALDRNMKWLLPLKDRLKHLLLLRERS